MTKYNVKDWEIVKRTENGLTYWQGFYDGDYHFTTYSLADTLALRRIRHNLWSKSGYPF